MSMTTGGRGRSKEQKRRVKTWRLMNPGMAEKSTVGKQAIKTYQETLGNYAAALGKPRRRALKHLILTLRTADAPPMTEFESCTARSSGCRSPR